MLTNLESKEQAAPKTAPSQEVVSQLWNEFLSSNKEKLDSFFLSYALLAKVKWNAPNTISFDLSSNIAQGTFNNNKVHYMMYFSERLLVENLTFEYIIEQLEIEDVSKSKAYTIKDRMIEIQEINPAIKILIEKLDLDF
ncbi:MAG: hypothetical protein M9958_07480 [Chitinophagales bacterium]|nr:hypothetical protein [Chitinophagales bacterium]